MKRIDNFEKFIKTIYKLKIEKNIKNNLKELVIKDYHSIKYLSDKELLIKMIKLIPIYTINDDQTYTYINTNLFIIKDMSNHIDLINILNLKNIFINYKNGLFNNLIKRGRI
jgi:hypothetical protein